jgi:ABC-2 type transport system ATP-binding protein
MTLELAAVGIGTEPGAALPVVSAVAAPGHPGIVAVETEQAPALASLVAGGRMKPDTGQVLLDGHDDPAAVRRAFALVDTPGVAEPFPVMTLKQIVHEELAFAGRRPSRSDVETVLDGVGVTRWADTHVQRVPTDARVRLLAELALLRPDVTGLVITSPERHGGAVADWFAVVRDIARRGVTVVLVTSKAAAETASALLATITDADAAASDADADADTGADAADTADAGATTTEGPEDATRTGSSPTGLPADTTDTTDATAPLETRS